jgi:hypothetical protein
MALLFFKVAKQSDATAVFFDSRYFSSDDFTSSSLQSVRMFLISRALLLLLYSQ